MKDKARILIIEDEPGVSMMMVYLLTQAGCEAVTAWNAEWGMRLAQAEEFDLTTLDVDLPDASGFKLCRRLKGNHRLCDTPIVYMSGRPCEQDVQHGLELGTADYIIEPFDALDFASRLLSHIKPMPAYA